ncbi:MAG: helix-hairpin-helix domain-containing protein [Acidobacteriota bacterium]|nr:helix-hairpin-helix domain-containing protein [Acidobacteriota bacterium]
MRHAVARSFLAASGATACVLAAGIAVSAGQSAAPISQAAPQQTVPAASAQADDKNAAVYTRVCSTCHEPERILSNRRTRDQWGEVIDKMVERGAQGSDEDFDAVLEYLMSHYGRVNVNRAAPEDLAAVLKLSEKDAQAIVVYRNENGPFADFDALAKVPGIDLEALTKSREAASF